MAGQPDLFEIRGLKCAYVHRAGAGRRVVLAIDRLSIPAETITVVLGRSGSGKSTLIETLGLMNDTFEAGSVIFRHGGREIVTDHGLWKMPAALRLIRARYFSFIFQNDFLLPHYTPMENLLLGRWDAKAPGRPDTGRGKAARFCSRVGIDLAALDDRPTGELSAGQRQRLAFVRALMKDHVVLFGDEPTGNLDEDSSRQVASLLSETVGPGTGRTAVIVSHNIPLTLEMAGRIVVLTSRGDISEVADGNVFTREGSAWRNEPGKTFSREELAARLRELAGPLPAGPQQSPGS